MQCSVEKIERVGNYAVIHLHFYAEDFKLPEFGVAHKHLSIDYLKASDKVYQGNLHSSYLIVNHQNCKNGKVSIREVVDLPVEYLKSEELVLKCTWKDVNTKDKTISFSNTIRPQAFSKETDQPIYAINYHRENTDNNGLSIPFHAFSETQETRFYVQVYYKDKRCNRLTDSLKLNTFFGAEIGAMSFFIPYSELYIPPGKKELTYTVFATSDSLLTQELFSGTVKLIQPQLHLLSFKTENADINVKGLDGFSNLGKGDAFFELSTASRLLFKSSSVYNSGKILPHKGSVQINLNDELTLSFMDFDDFNKNDFIQQIKLPTLQEGKQQIQIRNNGRIRKFDFNYTLQPMSEDISNQITSEL